MQVAIDRLATLSQLKGFRLLRLKSNRKQPIGNDWAEKSTASVATAAKWLARGNNIGVLCGTLLPNGHKLVVIDVDVKNDQPGMDSWRRLKQDFHLPRTIQVQSPSGGYHHYYAVPSDTPTQGAARLLQKLGYPGIDFLSERHLVVAPPSTTSDGDYEFVTYPEEYIEEDTGEKSLSLASVAFCKLLAAWSLGEPKSAREGRENTRKRTRSSEDADAAFEYIVAKFPVWARGQRNYRQTQAVASLLNYHKLTPDDAEIVMVKWLDHFQDSIGTPRQDCIVALKACLASAVRKLKSGGFAKPNAPDYTKGRHEHRLSGKSQQWLRRMLGDASGHTVHLYNRGEQTQDAPRYIPRLVPDKDAPLVEALLILCSYSISIGQSKLTFTYEQLASLLRSRFDVEHSGDDKYVQLRRRLDKYVTRQRENGTLHKATLLELLVREKMGSSGRPSVYRLAKMKDAF